MTSLLLQRHFSCSMEFSRSSDLFDKVWYISLIRVRSLTCDHPSLGLSANAAQTLVTPSPSVIPSPLSSQAEHKEQFLRRTEGAYQIADWPIQSLQLSLADHQVTSRCLVGTLSDVEAPGYHRPRSPCSRQAEGLLRCFHVLLVLSIFMPLTHLRSSGMTRLAMDDIHPFSLKQLCRAPMCLQACIQPPLRHGHRR